MISKNKESAPKTKSLLTTNYKAKNRETENP